MIVDGKIGVKHGKIKGFTEKGVVFEDGQELEAAEVVLATVLPSSKFYRYILPKWGC